MGSSQSSVTVEREFVEEDRMRTKEMEKAMDKVPEAMMSALECHGTKVIAAMMVLNMTSPHHSRALDSCSSSGWPSPMLGVVVLVSSALFIEGVSLLTRTSKWPVRMRLCDICMSSNTCGIIALSSRAYHSVLLLHV
ncbi:unnamed protein product [Vitrella brassicaformis CCMP3155]|uniref:Uncharacterized protein n=1 Tax=Vitrella brassicaformis (strain CCMP3155) TaxID=1169540 RepID=A0A0G4EJT5_VITBC|nr:unnamed protein product [Vitrella brassicaformis CCMP3155]|eukprot:CEL97017.1 unnamed protein product [Vitrella brassicaformis CCMP3155]